jgi:hypothetical protein
MLPEIGRLFRCVPLEAHFRYRSYKN